MNNAVKWMGAVALSLLAHAAGGYAVAPGEERETIDIAGSQAMEVTLLGNAFSDTIEAGDPTDPLDPIETPTETVQPEETPPVDVAVQEVAPVESEITPEASSDVVPTEADVILPAEDMPPLASEDPVVTATVAPVETVVPEEKPEQKPEPKKKAEPKREKAKPEKEKPPEKKPVRRKAGADGDAQIAQKKGQADGAENAASTASSGRNGRASQQDGNAAVSNYSGKISARLSRSIRYPSEARREGLRGSAQVRFTVLANGSVSGVSVVKSAGSPILDQAAIDTVQRAAPFPKIPAEAGRSSWVFTIPLAFTR